MVTKKLLKKSVFYLGFAVASIIVAVGIFWSFQRGANDFGVFYGSWELVARGEGHTIYYKTPDRFLYAPGFAWLFSPLGFLNKNAVLVLWSVAKVFALLFMLKSLNSVFGSHRFFASSIGAWAIVLMARPLLIDFQYGQVNTFIVCAAVCALVSHFSNEKASVRDLILWALLSIAALAKIFALPLLIIPWLVTRGIDVNRRKYEKIGVITGLILIVLLPATTNGFSGAWDLMLQWKNALMSKGLPTETHNQSIPALLYRYLSGEYVHIIARGPDPIRLGDPVFSKEVLAILSGFWTVISMSAFFVWLYLGKRLPIAKWMAVAIAFVIVPSHLVWKPYFVMAIPLAFVALQQVVVRFSFSRALLLLAVFISFNFTSIDFIGFNLATKLESISLMMFALLVMMASLLFSIDGRFSLLDIRMKMER